MTVIAKERAIGFFGKSERYFCEHCKSFIGGNPVKLALEGIAESIVSFFFFIGSLAVSYANRDHSAAPSGPTAIVASVILIGVFDGFRRCWTGLRALRRKPTYAEHLINCRRHNIGLRRTRRTAPLTQNVRLRLAFLNPYVLFAFAAL